jgi:hypothetical protein
MRHTFKATFEHQSDAQRLMDDLHAAGYAHAELARSGATHSGPYTRQRHAVELSVDSESEAGLAADIIERAKPARFQVERNDSVDSMTVVAPATDRIVPAWPPGAEPGALQFRPLDDGHIFGTQSATSPPAGMTYQERMSAPALLTGADTFVGQSSATAKLGRMDLDTDVQARDDAKSSALRGSDKITPDIDDGDYYRGHRTTSHAHDAVAYSGDDATPAYMDEGMAQGSEKYLSPAAGSTRQLSSWGRFEDAVFHGWERINSTRRDPVRASDTGATDEAYRRSTAHGEATGLEPASDDHQEAGERRISPWEKVRVSMHQGWKRVRA